MALEIDASTPTLATSSTATVTSASFTPPDNALLVVAWAANNPTGSDPSDPTITDDLGVPLTYTLSNWRNRADLSPNHVDGQTAIWTAPVPTSQPMSVSVTNGAASSRHAALKIWVVTGADPDTPLGAEGEASSLSAGSISQDYTAEATSSQGFMVACDWDTLGAMTEGSGCTFDHTGDIAGQISYGFLRRTTDDGSLGATTTLACTLSGTSTNLSWVWVELIPAAVNEDLIDPPPFLRHFPGGQPPPTNFLKPWFGAGEGAAVTPPARTAPTFPDAQDLAEGSGTRNLPAVTTAANDWIVVQVIGEDGGVTALVDITPSCAGLSFAKQADNGGSGDTRQQIYTAADGTGGSRTVQLTPSPSASRTYRARVTVVRGSEGPGGAGTSITAQTASVVRQRDNSAVFMQVGDWSTGAVGTPVWTPGGSTTASQQGANATYIFGRYNDAGTAGTANHGISSPSYTTPACAALEMFGASTDTSIPYSPQPRTPQPVRDVTQWLQPARQTSQATAAGPLVAPLDSAYQAGAGYWHLYNPAPTTAWRPQQRATFDPTLLSPAAADIPAPSSPEPAAYVDRRQVPAQPLRISDPALLATALLENELLGGSGTGQRAQTAATHVQRWWMPRQPDRETPGLLDQSLLENELLGRADDRRHTAAQYVDRRLVPQQRPYVSDPGLLPTALLEAPLLGGPEPGRRAAATHAERRTTQQPRPAYAQFPAVDFDPLTSGWIPTWQDYNQAALHVDRRQVPQQRTYLSDPSFYPTVPPTDPLTVAWGAGGSYWWLYNTAAAQTDRRLAPAQRRYQSEPALLTTALLESPLLTGARQAGYADRRVTVAPRAGGDPNLFSTVTDPVTLAAGVGGDLWRRYQTAAYADRRQTATQPPRRIVYFDAGPGSPPLTLAWGVGGHYWHLYNTAAGLAPRVWQPQQWSVSTVDAVVPVPGTFASTTATPSFTSTSAGPVFTATSAAGSGSSNSAPDGRFTSTSSGGDG